MVEVCGMGGGDEINLRQYRSLEDGKRLDDLSEEQLAILDRQVNELIGRRAADGGILRENRTLLETLRDLLVEKKTDCKRPPSRRVAEDKGDQMAGDDHPPAARSGDRQAKHHR